MILDKLRYGAINNKKIIFFLFGICIIGIISGSLFITIISKTDQKLVIDYMGNYINNINNISIKDTFLNSILTNLFFILAIWLLGISIIGIPIIIFMYFSKFFILGFSISSFILTYKLKGLVIALIYVFPSQIINILTYTLISLYAIKISNNLIYSIFNNKKVEFKAIINKYVYILIICLIASLICSIYDNMIVPIIYNNIKVLLKI